MPFFQPPRSDLFGDKYGDKYTRLFDPPGRAKRVRMRMTLLMNSLIATAFFLLVYNELGYPPELLVFNRR